ncbi:TetR/AcrR family transcriptional regulator [Rhizobiaceae bacterium n13]|uniref:TetR/AcrR family transcriptional regulator n=1 Tax=Ferirhizobium litorale TaxID=2927786 RepID=A0AAE3QC57_9HYPH|nr:TetR/AcrR family transcriptional regulator [Fererhizobium litorale]MDI7864650.1 TetR/AcrR family transcriptional regulator [Fererhizobium litorale]MDI7922141.1 TetR/AcrR family transcriptional regulator [Fererhizobium litorale]
MTKAERTRQFIVERTAPIFNAKGYAGTSIADMTEATGLTKGSIYGNFANKDEVALAAFGHNWQRVKSMVRAQMDKHPTSKGKLLSLMGVYADLQSCDFPEGGCPLLNTAVEADDTHPSLRAEAVKAFDGWKHNIVAVVEAGIAAGEFRAGVDAEQTAVTLIALIEGALMISQLTGNAGYRAAVMPAIERTIYELA